MIALVKDGDTIIIDIPNRTIQLAVSDADPGRRHTAMKARADETWGPENGNRQVSTALRAYAALTISAAHGAVREARPSG